MWLRRLLHGPVPAEPHVKVTVLSGTNLPFPASAQSGGCAAGQYRPYVVLQLGTHTARSRPGRGVDPEFQQTFALPPGGRTLLLTVFHGPAAPAACLSFNKPLCQFEVRNVHELPRNRPLRMQLKAVDAPGAGLVVVCLAINCGLDVERARSVERKERDQRFRVEAEEEQGVQGLATSMATMTQLLEQAERLVREEALGRQRLIALAAGEVTGALCQWLLHRIGVEADGARRTAARREGRQRQLLHSLFLEGSGRIRTAQSEAATRSRMLLWAQSERLGAAIAAEEFAARRPLADAAAALRCAQAAAAEVAAETRRLSSELRGDCPSPDGPAARSVPAPSDDPAMPADPGPGAATVRPVHPPPSKSPPPSAPPPPPEDEEAAGRATLEQQCDTAAAPLHLVGRELAARGRVQHTEAAVGTLHAHLAGALAIAAGERAARGILRAHRVEDEEAVARQELDGRWRGALRQTMGEMHTLLLEAHCGLRRRILLEEEAAAREGFGPRVPPPAPLPLVAEEARARKAIEAEAEGVLPYFAAQRAVLIDLPGVLRQFESYWNSGRGPIGRQEAVERNCIEAAARCHRMSTWLAGEERRARGPLVRDHEAALEALRRQEARDLAAVRRRLMEALQREESAHRLVLVAQEVYLTNALLQAAPSCVLITGTFTGQAPLRIPRKVPAASAMPPLGLSHTIAVPSDSPLGAITRAFEQRFGVRLQLFVPARGPPPSSPTPPPPWISDDTSSLASQLLQSLRSRSPSPSPSPSQSLTWDAAGSPVSAARELLHASPYAPDGSRRSPRIPAEGSLVPVTEATYRRLLLAPAAPPPIARPLLPSPSPVLVRCRGLFTSGGVPQPPLGPGPGATRSPQSPVEARRPGESIVRQRLPARPGQPAAAAAVDALVERLLREDDLGM